MVECVKDTSPALSIRPEVTLPRGQPPAGRADLPERQVRARHRGRDAAQLARRARRASTIRAPPTRRAPAGADAGRAAGPRGRHRLRLRRGRRRPDTARADEVRRSRAVLCRDSTRRRACSSAARCSAMACATPCCRSRTMPASSACWRHAHAAGDLREPDQSGHAHRRYRRDHRAGARGTARSRCWTTRWPASTSMATADVDLFIHSLTKYASGHGDVMGGVVIADARADRASCGRTSRRWAACSTRMPHC